MRKDRISKRLRYAILEELAYSMLVEEQPEDADVFFIAECMGITADKIIDLRDDYYNDLLILRRQFLRLVEEFAKRRA